MKLFLLLAFLPTIALSKEVCIRLSGFEALDEIAHLAILKCQSGDLAVEPVCYQKLDGGYMTLWKVNNISGVVCSDNSNFSHNPDFHNLPGEWAIGVNHICSGLWSGHGLHTLNVTGKNHDMSLTSSRPCSGDEATQAKNLCGFAPLPITLKSFTVKYNPVSRCVDVHFSTASEMNSDLIMVERGNDGKTFSSVRGGSIASKFPSGGGYKYEDCESKPGGTYYYRLRQKDFDGTETLFKTVAINIKQSTFRTTVYPNPTQAELNVDFDTFNRRLVIVRIFDTAGKLVTKTQYNLDGYQQGIKIPVQSHAAGMYILQLLDENGKEIHTSKFVKY